MRRPAHSPPAAQRHDVPGMYHLTHTLDADRPVVGNDGWERVATDIIGIHDDDHPERLARCYVRLPMTDAGRP